MNAALRRLTVALLVLFGMLFVNLNYVHVVAADRLRKDPRNARLLLETYSRERGAIVSADDVVLAQSRKTDDRLAYLREYGSRNPELARAFAPVTGYYSLVYGTAGVERAYDDVLSGEDERLFIRRVSDVITGRTIQGGTVRLTLDTRVQMAAAKALGARRGAVAVLDPRTGAVLALVTSPTYDPNPLSTHDPRGIRLAYDKLLDDAQRPLLNRATQQTFPPGSVFKIVTSATALSSGRYRPETPVPCPRTFPLPNSNRSIANFGGASCEAPQVSLLDAFRQSRNTAFAALALDLGAPAMQEQARKFGFDAAPRLDLPAAASRYPDDPDRAQTALSGIGQFDVRVSPLQMALVAAGVANRGVVMAPYVVSQLLAPDFRELEKTEPTRMPGQPALSPEAAAQLTQMMIAVVNNGTGGRAAIAGVQVAGKTGTAQHAEGKAPHAWFVGFAPAEAPRVVVAVVVEEGGDVGSEATGGRLAAPIAAQVLQAALGAVR